MPAKQVQQAAKLNQAKKTVKQNKNKKKPNQVNLNENKLSQLTKVKNYQLPQPVLGHSAYSVSPLLFQDSALKNLKTKASQIKV